MSRLPDPIPLHRVSLISFHCIPACWISHCSHPDVSHTTAAHPTASHPIALCPILLIQPCFILSHWIPSSWILSHPTGSHPAGSCPISLHPILLSLFCCIPSHEFHLTYPKRLHAIPVPFPGHWGLSPEPVAWGWKDAEASQQDLSGRTTLGQPTVLFSTSAG